MRTSMVGAALLLVGAGAISVAASTGNDISLTGSDTLYEVTQDVITACKGKFADFASHNISYQGGGSGVGANSMNAGAQELAPMSRAMKNTEYCGGSTSPADPTKSASLLLGLDGVAVVANKGTSCAQNGVASGKTINVLAGGTGAATGTYTINNSFDALKVLYFGLTNDGTFNCASDVRKTLIKQWNALFSTDCGAGGSVCTSGISHAWRRGDLSGTTDTFVSVVGAGARGLGNLSTLPSGVSAKVNPFCNTYGANNNTSSLADDGNPTNGQVDDYTDLDPVRTACDSSDTTCGAKDLGVVLPIVIPDVTYAATEVYPNVSCGGSCVLVPIIKGTRLKSTYRCPNGTKPVLGRCFMPFVSGSADKDPRCLAAKSTRCFGTPSGTDGRVHNQVTVVLQSEVPAAAQFAGAKYQFAADKNNRVIAGSFFRQHMTAPSTYSAGGATCKELDDTSAIGCLTDADTCSVGFAGRLAASTFPGGAADLTKALTIDGTAPTDQAIQNLLAAPGTTPLYKLSRRLYLSTNQGFLNIPGQPGSGEAELLRCFGDNNILNAAITNNHYLPVPGGVQCLDYPENAATSTPAANTQGPGNVALGGCGLASNVDACSGVAAAIFSN